MNDRSYKERLSTLGDIAKKAAETSKKAAAKHTGSAPLSFSAKEIVEAFSEYGRKLLALDYDIGTPTILWKEDGRCLKTTSGADFANLGYDDILDCTHFSLPEKDVLLKSKDMRTMILARPPYIGMCLDQGRPIEAVLDDMAMIIGKDVKIVPREQKAIARALKGRYAVMLQGAAGEERSGEVLVTGRTLYEAYTALTVLEKAAELMLKADVLGGGKPVPPFRAALEHQIYTRKYSQAELKRKQRAAGSAEARPQGASNDAATTEAAADDARPASVSEEEYEKRCLLVEYGKKLLASGLVQGTWGNLSVRLDEEYMLVTPSGRDYATLRPMEEVKVAIATQEYEGDLKPTSETMFHAGLYTMRSDIGAIVHTHSKYCAVYAAAHMPLEMEEPETAAELGDFLPVAEYGLAGTKKLSQNVLDVMERGTGCLMRNHGMIAVGADLPEAFARAVKMEQAAEYGVERRWEQRTSKE